MENNDTIVVKGSLVAKKPRVTVKLVVDSLVAATALAHKVDDKTARTLLGIALAKKADDIFAATNPSPEALAAYLAE